MQKHPARLRRAHKLGPLNVFVENTLVQVSSEAWIRKGLSFATLFLSRDANDDVLLTTAHGSTLDEQGEVEAQYKGRMARFVRVA